jgi:hypothetical protein
MNEIEREEINRRAQEIFEEFAQSPERQSQLIDELRSDGIIDDRGQVICLANGKHPQA